MGVLGNPFGACRFCKEMDWIRKDGITRLWSYGVRHRAHAECGLKAKGVAFLDLIPAWQLGEFPAPVAAKFGLLEEVIRRLEALQENRARR